MEKYSEQRLGEKVVLITGAASGIGRAAAIRLAQEGARVVVNDINQAKIDETVQAIKAFGGEALGYLADVTKKTEVDAMVEAVYETFGRINILFANAGIADYADFVRMKEDFFKLYRRKKSELCSCI